MTTFQAAQPLNAAPADTRRDPVAVLATSTFSAGVLLLPGELRGDAKRLYYLLRTIDDLVDENDPHAPERVNALQAWANHEPADTPETRTLTFLCERHPLSREAVGDFAAGMRHDLDHNTMQTGQDLDLYCHQVAGTVGIMLTSLFGCSHPDCEQRMDQLGRAMQLTNILRDIDEDHANGRSYMPQTLIDQYGPPVPGHRKALLEDQIARADQLYVEGLAAIPLLQRGGLAMHVSTVLYREILRQIERDGYGHHPGCAQVPGWRKEQLITQTLRRTPRVRDKRPKY